MDLTLGGNYEIFEKNDENVNKYNSIFMSNYF
jgi:hypothetical protein